MSAIDSTAITTATALVESTKIAIRDISNDQKSHRRMFNAVVLDGGSFNFGECDPAIDVSALSHLGNIASSSQAIMVLCTERRQILRDAVQRAKSAMAQLLEEKMDPGEHDVVMAQLRLLQVEESRAETIDDALETLRRDAAIFVQRQLGLFNVGAEPALAELIKEATRDD